jgi:NAD(P)-dependent dehydrogenase (short-subunit alcohol dehydrogenase family)
MTLENGWHRFDLNIRGAITAVSSVLPGMVERRRGTLLFCGGASITNPVRTHTSYTLAAAPLRKYVHNLDLDLAADGIRAALVMVAGAVLPDGIELSGLLGPRKRVSSCSRCFVRVRSPNSCGSCTALASATRRTRATSTRSWRWLRRARWSSVD